MRDILDEIIANKQIELAQAKSLMSTAELEIKAGEVMRSTISMRESLLRTKGGVISEFKRRSPSKGWINQEADSAVIPAGYARSGAAALSILTDEKYFGGRLSDIETARPMVGVPILRKDFIIDEYQIFEASIVGADAVLLIAAALTKERCVELLQCAHSFGLEVLLEIHSEQEMKYITHEVDMVGVNNRHLGSFVTDVQTSFQLAELLPRDTVLVSESGISNPEVVNRLQGYGFRGFLIGENFMKTNDPAEALRAFIEELD